MPERKYELNELTAISPIDGRYRAICEVLTPHASEFGLTTTRLKKKKFRGLTPENYLGLAENLTELAIDEIRHSQI